MENRSISILRNGEEGKLKIYVQFWSSWTSPSVVLILHTNTHTQPAEVGVRPDQTPISQLAGIKASCLGAILMQNF